MAIINITAENYDKLIHSTETVLLDFWAPWCGPCRMIAPILEEITGAYPNILLGKINVDAQMALASRFGITSIPTVIAVKQGEITGKLVGCRPREEIEGLLK